MQNSPSCVIRKAYIYLALYVSCGLGKATKTGFGQWPFIWVFCFFFWMPCRRGTCFNGSLIMLPPWHQMIFCIFVLFTVCRRGLGPLGHERWTRKRHVMWVCDVNMLGSHRKNTGQFLKRTLVNSEFTSRLVSSHMLSIRRLGIFSIIKLSGYEIYPLPTI